MKLWETESNLMFSNFRMIFHNDQSFKGFLQNPYLPEKKNASAIMCIHTYIKKTSENNFPTLNV